MVAGFALLALWETMQTIRKGPLPDRLKAVSKFLVYVVLAWTAGKFAIGSAVSISGREVDFTAAAMHDPGGRLFVAVIGLVVIGVGCYHVYKGAVKKFLQDLQEHPGSIVIHAARAGYIAKDVALFMVGVLFLVAAVHDAPSKATGLDGGLRTLRQAPVGTMLVSLVAIGIAAYGAYSIARARYART